MLMYQFRKLSAHVARIFSVQFALAFQRASVIGATLPFGEKKGSNRSRIELASSALAEKAFDRCKRRLNPFESNASLAHRHLDYMESQNKTLQSRFMGLLSLLPINKATTLHCTHTVKIAPRLNLPTPRMSSSHIKFPQPFKVVSVYF